MAKLRSGASHRLPLILSLLACCSCGLVAGAKTDSNVTMVCSRETLHQSVRGPAIQERRLTNEKKAALYAFKPLQQKTGQLMRFKVDANANNDTALPELHAYLFNDKNPTCDVRLFSELSSIFVDCIDAIELAKCLTVSPIWQLQMGALNSIRESVSEQLDPTLHLSMNETGSFITSLDSNPVYNSSVADVVWYVLVIIEPPCDQSSYRCPKMKRQEIDFKLQVEMTHEGDVHGKLWTGAFQMFFAPIFVLVAADSVRMLVRAAIVKHPPPREDRPLSWKLYQECIYDKGQWWLPHWLSLLLMCALTWISGSAQFVFSSFLGMIRDGNRDTCFYNEQCYYPGGADLAVNNIISHIPFVVCGIYSFFMSSRAQIHIFRRMPVDTKLICEVNVFNGLALALLLEAFGSILYHICPSSYVFQFDTTFMLPICHLSIYAVLSISEDLKETRRSGKRPVRYFLLIACPLWIFGFIGTWIDMGQLNWSFDKASKVMALLYFCWAMYAVLHVLVEARPDKNVARHIPRWMRKEAILKLPLGFVLCLSVGVLLKGNLKIAAGQTPNVLLAFSVVVMVIAFFTRVGFHLASLGRNFWRSAVPICMAMIIAVTIPSLDSFNNLKVNNVLSTAEISRSTNRPCITVELAGFSQETIFDDHDMWHLGSAVGLALWIMCLLELRLEGIRIGRGSLFWAGSSDQASMSLLEAGAKSAPARI